MIHNKIWHVFRHSNKSLNDVNTTPNNLKLKNAAIIIWFYWWKYITVCIDWYQGKLLCPSDDPLFRKIQPNVLIKVVCFAILLFNLRDNPTKEFNCFWMTREHNGDNIIWFIFLNLISLSSCWSNINLCHDNAKQSLKW